MEKVMKYVLVTGGVVSGIGKGVTASSLGLLLKACGLRVTFIKIDPYLNTDAGTMSPFEHGEVYVLDDGGEVDLDLGNYERFLDIKLTRDHNITTGKIYQAVINKERRGDYLGKTVQVVPHISDAIQEWIERVATIAVDGIPDSPDVCVIELGGTIGDIESMPFTEALRQFPSRVGRIILASPFDIVDGTIRLLGNCHVRNLGDEWYKMLGLHFYHSNLLNNAKILATDGPPWPTIFVNLIPIADGRRCYRLHFGAGNFCLIHVSLVPVLNVVGEQKTKPTQHSVRELRGCLGLTPNILACRSTLALDENVKLKLFRFCHVPAQNIVSLYDVPNIWHIPLVLREQKAHEAILRELNLSTTREPTLQDWTYRAKICDKDSVRIAMVGKYRGLTDSYLSVINALLDASFFLRKKLVVNWVIASDLEDEAARENPDAYKAAWKLLKGADGVLVPGGFGARGVQGKILSAKYARLNRIPFLGICLGMQTAVIEFARSVLGLPDANSAEFDPYTKNPCVILMPEGSKTHMGATMRLGVRRTYFQVRDCKSAKLYGNRGFADERHRHRYEVNQEIVASLEEAGLSFTGTDVSTKRMEIIELPNHPYYIGVQFHPEFNSRPWKASPLFLGLIAAACGHLDAVLPTGM